MAKETVVSVRLDNATEKILERCKSEGHFASTTDTIIAGLRVLARELRHQAIRQEIVASGRSDAQDSAFAVLGLAEWQSALERADRGDL